MRAAYFNKFTIFMRAEEALDASAQVDCTGAVEALLKDTYHSAQLAEIPADDIRAELKECGAWTPEELRDDLENRKRILWIAADHIRCDIRDEEIYD